MTVAQNDNQVKLTVQDNGCGVPENAIRSNHSRHDNNARPCKVYEAIAASAANQVAPKWWSPLFPKKLSQTSKEIPMSNQEPATILLIDDHPMLRTGVKQLISMAPDITVVGEASRGGFELAESIPICQDPTICPA